MEKIKKIGKYNQKINLENGKILKVWCDCKHFSLYPNNFFEGKTICWHLREAISPSSTKKLSEVKKELLRKFVNYKCENCKKKNKKLILHRIKRGRDGGIYELRNIKMLCNSCHIKIHSGEFYG